VQGLETFTIRGAVMFGFSDMFLTKEQIKCRDQREREIAMERIKRAEPWDPEMKWEYRLTLQAKTYKPLSLFDVPPMASNDVNDATLRQTVHSPKKQFCYVEKRLKTGTRLQTVNGRRRGDVMWDGPVVIPALHERDHHCKDRWDVNPWMSITPMEIMTLRPGTRRAKGRTIVAGLGLGYQLIEVSKRKQVKELVLLEKSAELVEWLLPRIKPLLHCELKDVVIGDAYKKLPKMKADVALIDIFRSYGANKFEKLVPVSAHRNEFVPVECSDIKSIWCWGRASLRD
jgi:hypothetical protein